jgi:cytosine/adenosine deaminase-related metal-dependent hydrolase
MAWSTDRAGRSGAQVTLARSSVGSGRTFINARFSDGNIGTLRIVGSHIAAVAEDPWPGDAIIDLQGDRVLPGLINAHDHLQLNNMPFQGCGKRFEHVRDWISEVDASRRSDPAFEASVAVARDARLVAGGVKNLLSGVTTVAHHDPLYPCLLSAHYPIRVVRRYGWSHSLYIDGEDQVRNSHRSTPADWPWIIHAAEGLNPDAGNEFERLDALGCLGPNTLLVHGIALDRAQRTRLEHAGGGLIWCPSSNLRLFGKTADITGLRRHGRVALGTDSRLSGARDLLDELRIAGAVGDLDDGDLEQLVTRDSARLLRLPDCGSLQPGACADLLILRAGTALSAASRADVRLVLIAGIVRYGERSCAQRAEPASRWADVRVDGEPKILDRGIAELLSDSGVCEIGLELTHVARRTA